MKLYSTKNKAQLFSLKEAVMKGLPADNGLFMPTEITSLPADFFTKLKDYSFRDLAYEVARTLIAKSAIPDEALEQIITQSINFPAPVISLSKQLHILELFHGPSLAFKDFGARFMAQTMSYFNANEDKDLVILVATSGDTGGAVAAGFYQTPGIKVVILYPSGKVSPLQEKQLTTLGHNITAIEIDGTFDDCQALVKQAFLDESLNQQHRLSSANSINIARLIPQSFYYFEAYKQLEDTTTPLAFIVPSGNFGNLTAGLFANRMGLPVQHFVAATNINDIVPNYLKTGEYSPRPSERTLSNAMDVGNPSNFSRMLDLYGSTWNNMKEKIKGFAYDDAQTEDEILRIFNDYNYVIDPHGAVGTLAHLDYQKLYPNSQSIVLETAHPAKFLETVDRIVPRGTIIPERLAKLANLPKAADFLSPNFPDFKEWLLHFN
ncbi:MAG: threonine synthase [Bacteroidota bacterium]